jgi:UDP-glucose:glycoprotein glucosyltransferase
MSYDDVIAPGSIYRTWLESVKAMSDRIGVNTPSHFVNGKYFAWNEVRARIILAKGPAI